jgi:synaptojanin
MVGLLVDSLTVLSRLESVEKDVDRFGFSMCDASSDEIITDQKGIFRTNCLDW